MSRRKPKSTRVEVEFGPFTLIYQKYPFGAEPWKWRLTTERDGAIHIIKQGEAVSEKGALDDADTFISDELLPKMEVAAAFSVLKIAARDREDIRRQFERSNPTLGQED